MSTTIQRPEIAAFFDFDETLLAIDSAGIGFKLLREQGYISKLFTLKMTVVMLLFKMGIIDDQAVAKAMLSFYKGRTLQPFIESAQDFYQEYLKPNLAPHVVDKLIWHQQQGHETVLISGSIDYYLKPVMQDLDISHLLCTYLETGTDGLLTGRSEGPVCVGVAKVTLAHELSEREGIDLSRSYAYGNSHLDIPILEQVGHPVMVNPSQALSRYGKRKEWTLL